MSFTPKDEEKYVALSFDDGPNLITTPAMLDMLKKHDVVASFFVVGDSINDQTKEVMKRAISQGCEIENHSRTHNHMNRMEEEAVKAEISFTSAAVEEVTGRKPEYFRPPYISVNQDMYDWIDLTFISGKGCNDWDAKYDKDFRVNGLLKAAEPGTIFLLHDFVGNDATVQAIDEVIPALKAQGYTFVTVSQLFKLLKSEGDGQTIYSVVPDNR
ncbi:MAG: polysaccharide deacetylase family protein [Bacteroidales bacterium]|nr:polysaccharide deacetylase family protein [Bacteroidales bacterium]